MSVLTQPPISTSPPRKRFTRAEVEQMLEAGLFAGERFELIDGDLIDKMGQNPPHASAIRILLEWLAKVLGLDRILVQLPIEASAADRERSLPEPDLAVLAEPKPDYRRRHPRGDELLLAIEVADTTLQFDTITKRDLYARAGVLEYWVVDLNARLIVHRSPFEGKFQHVSFVGGNDTVSPESRPDAHIPVAELFP